MWMQHSFYHKCQINSITSSCFAFTRTKTPQSFWVSADGQSCRPLALPLWSSSHQEREESWPARTKIALSWNLEKFCWESHIIVLWISQVTPVLTKRENSKVNMKTGLTTFFFIFLKIVENFKADRKQAGHWNNNHQDGQQSPTIGCWHFPSKSHHSSTCFLFPSLLCLSFINSILLHIFNFLTRKSSTSENIPSDGSGHHTFLVLGDDNNYAFTCSHLFLDSLLGHQVHGALQLDHQFVHLASVGKLCHHIFCLCAPNHKKERLQKSSCSS